MKRAILIGIALSVVSQLAYAADDRAAADALITKGLELRREGRALEAIGLFQRAVAIAPTPRSVGQLGLAESALEHWSERGRASRFRSGLAARPVGEEEPRRARPGAHPRTHLHIGQMRAHRARRRRDHRPPGRSLGTLPLTKAIRTNAGPALDPRLPLLDSGSSKCRFPSRSARRPSSRIVTGTRCGTRGASAAGRGAPDPGHTIGAGAAPAAASRA